MYQLPEQRPTVNPGLQRENLIYISFFQLYSSMMRLMRKNYDVRNEDCYKPVPPDILSIIDQQYESLKSVTSYDLNARPVEDRVYAWQIYDVDPIYSTSLFLINQLGYTELALLGLEHPLIYQTSSEWFPPIGTDVKREEYINLEAECYLVPLRLLVGYDLPILQSTYSRRIGRFLLSTTLIEYFTYKFSQQLGYPERHLVNVLVKDSTRQLILDGMLDPVNPVTHHHLLYDEFLDTYDFKTDECLGRVLDMALNYESWVEKNESYPWLLSLYCACLDLFKPNVSSSDVTHLNTCYRLHYGSPEKIRTVIKSYIERDIACTAKELVMSLCIRQERTI